MASASDVTSFLDRFGPDRDANQAQWERCPANPVIPYGAAWCRDFIGPSSVLVDGDTVTLYAEGGADDRESFGRYSLRGVQDFATGWVADARNPLLAPSEHAFDRGSVFDPAAVRFRGRTHVYYSATAGGAHAFAELADAAGPEVPDDETIGHAVETHTGLEREPQPVVVGRCPYVIEHRGGLFLFYVKVIAGGYRIHGARSADGKTFIPTDEGPVLDVGQALSLIHI